MMQNNKIIKALGPVVSDKKIFSHFTYISLCKTCDPLGGAISGPRSLILNKFGRGSHGDAKYQISIVYAFWFQTIRFFLVFPVDISLCKTFDPRGRDIFCPRSII